MPEPIPKITTDDPPAVPRPFPLNGSAETNAIFQPPAPTEYSSEGLIFDDGIPMETNRHRQQMNLLIESLYLHWADRHDFYCGGNMFVYFSPDQVKTEDFRGPDFFVALGVDGRRERKGWVVWEEGGKAPDVVVELLSESTAEFDRTRKKEIYATRLGVREYYLCDPWGDELDGFELKNGVYQSLPFDAQGRLISPLLGLAFVRRLSKFHDVTTTWLRFETLDGQLLLSGEERAVRERQRAEQEHQRAEQERSRAELMAAKLRELGIDPETLPGSV